MRFPLSISFLKLAVPREERTADPLCALHDASERMPEGSATYAREAVDNWPAAMQAEERLPSSF